MLRSGFVLLLEGDSKIPWRVCIDGMHQLETDGLRLACCARNRPTALPIGINRGFRRESRLGERGLRRMQREGIMSVLRPDVEFGEYKVAVLAASWAAGWQRRIRKHFQLETGDNPLGQCNGDAVRIRCGEISGDQRASVRLLREGSFLLAFGERRQEGGGERGGAFERLQAGLRLFLPFRQLHCNEGADFLIMLPVLLKLRQMLRVVFFVRIQIRFRDADLRDRFVGVIEECKQLVVLVLRDLVVFVRVAARAAHGETEPDAAGCFRAVEHGFHPVLFLIDAPFAVGKRLPVECSRENLLGRWALEQVASELLHSELIQRHVLIDRLDHPVPVTPRIRASAVLFVPIAVGVPGLIQPVAAPALTEMRRGERAIHKALVSCGRLVLEKSCGLLLARRQPQQVVVNAL